MTPRLRSLRSSRSLQRRSERRHRALLALLGAGAFLVVTVLLDLIFALQGAHPKYLSDLAARPAGWVWTMGLLVLGMAVGLMAQVAVQILPSTRARRIAVGSAWVAAIGIGLIALVPLHAGSFPNTPVAGSTPHYAVVAPTFAAFTAAPVLFGFAMREHPEGRAMVLVSFAVTGVLIAAGILFVTLHVTDIHASGIMERVMVAAAVLWLAWMARWARGHPASTRRSGLLAAGPRLK